eukprot:TRINITY_DN453_c0_g1_i2.p1 TRINITY_DN453_c0_g1~~TRINITY_DN453_c0_g1_i2.p1  ORF type:complete len:237 (+),score=15.22 TRINITY_DN453_c0_g1_i2:141-851(+)
MAKKNEEKEMEVVKGLELQRYMGKWYEIASMPSRFQPKNGSNTTATYSLNNDNTVHVVNETFSDGKKASIEGTAYKIDANSDDAKFKVKFMVPPFLPIIPVYGNYWVLRLDPDYRWAMVGEPSRKYLWVRTHIPSFSVPLSYFCVLGGVAEGTRLTFEGFLIAKIESVWVWMIQILCREREMAEETYNELVECAREQGYDVSRLRKTQQSAAAEAEEAGASKDKSGLWWIKSLFGK